MGFLYFILAMGTMSLALNDKTLGINSNTALICYVFILGIFVITLKLSDVCSKLDKLKKE